MSLQNPQLLRRRPILRLMIIFVVAMPIVMALSGLAVGGATSLTCAAFLVGVGFFYAREHTHQLWVGDDGIELRRLEIAGFKTTTIRFDEIESIYYCERPAIDGIDGFVSRYATVTTTTTGRDEAKNEIRVVVEGKGKRIKGSQLNEGITTLYGKAAEATHERMTTAALSRVRGGAPVTFGPITFDKRGIRVGSKPPIKWSELAEIDASDDKFVIASPSSRHGFYADEIPNLEVLVRVLNTLRPELG